MLSVLAFERGVVVRDSAVQSIVARMFHNLSESVTIAEACTAVYGQASGYQHLLMIEKTGAYIEHLYERGMIEITNPEEIEQGQPAKYRKLQEIADNELLPKQRDAVVE